LVSTHLPDFSHTSHPVNRSCHVARDTWHDDTLSSGRSCIRAQSLDCCVKADVGKGRGQSLFYVSTYEIGAKGCATALWERISPPREKCHCRR
jgi:hypothetical protein